MKKITLSPWELHTSDDGGWQRKAEALVAEKGADAYRMDSETPVRLSVAIEHEAAKAEFIENGGHITYGQFFTNSRVRKVLDERLLPRMQALDDRTGGTSGVSDFIVGLQQTWHHTAHRLAGEHVYEVSPNLARMLRHTSLKGVKAEDMRLPYRNICVILPAEEVGLNLLSHKDDKIRLRSFYITEDSPDPLCALKHPKPGVIDPITGIIWNSNLSRPKYDENFEGRVWRVLCFSGIPGDDPWKERITQYHIPLPNGEAINDIIARLPVSVPGWLDMFRWAMNVVMYSTWPDADAEHLMANEEAQKLWQRIQKLPKGKKRDDLKERFKGMEPHWRTYLGRTLPIWKANPAAEGTGQKLLTRTLVEGHWQRYWYGARESADRQSKWKFRAPFWRGPLDGPESNPRHVLV